MWEWPTQLTGMRSDAYVKCLLAFCACLLLVLLLPGMTVAEEDECDFQQFATSNGLYYNSEVECERKRDGKKPLDPPLCESDVVGACMCSSHGPSVLQRRERCVEPASGSSYHDPRVRLSYYRMGQGVSERELSIGDCALPHFSRHCARLAPHIETAKYAPEEKQEEMEGIYRRYGNIIAPEKLRLCVYEDPLDPADTKLSFSPFHFFSTAEEAGRVTEMMNKMHTGVGSDAANDAGVLAGLYVGLTKFKFYNQGVKGIVGCAPVPLAPFPPEFCDECDVTPPTPEPLFEFAADATFAEPTIVVTPMEREQSSGGAFDWGDLIESQPVTLEKDSCDILGIYCSELRSNGRNVCLKMNTQAHPNRIVGCKPRPDYMPLPVVSNDLDSVDPLAMKVSLSSGGKTEEKTLYATDVDAKCSDFMGVELCSERPCAEFDFEAGACTTYDTEVCLQGYEPERFEVEGYHPSKGVVAEVENDNILQGEIVQGEPNSFDDGKYYYDYPDMSEMSEDDRLFASDQTHRPFTQQELGLCISSPASIFTTPGQNEYIVPDQCAIIEVQVWGGGAAGFSAEGGSSIATVRYALGGGGGGYVRARLPVTQGQRFYTKTGAGGKEMGANGDSSYFSRTRASIDIEAGGAGSSVWDGSPLVDWSLATAGSASAQGIAGMQVLEATEGGGSQTKSHIGSACVSGGMSGNKDGMSEGDCRASPGGVIPANNARYGIGGCVCTPPVNAWGQGANGAVIVKCVTYKG